MKFYFVLLGSLLLTANSFASRPTCPPVELVKSAKFIRAFNDPNDHDIWNFSSQALSHDTREWNVAFGTFLRGVRTQADALRKGQAYFDKQILLIPHPKPVRIPENILFCDYMPTGHLFWTSALNPPQYKGRTK